MLRNHPHKPEENQLIEGISPLEADLLSLLSVSSLNASNFDSKFSTDLANLRTDVDFVRHDLGLKLT